MTQPSPRLHVQGGPYAYAAALSGVHAGVAIDYDALPLPEIYRRVLGGEPFEASEFSLSNTMIMRDRGLADFIAVPVFPNRAFRHHVLVVPRDSPLSDPADLRGRRVGVVDYTMTAAVWLRGLLAEEFGLHWSDVSWVSTRNQRFDPPAAAPVELVEDDPEELLLSGEIAALVSPHPRHAARLRPLLPDVAALERAAYDRTGVFPINHAIVLPAVPALPIPVASKALQDAHRHAWMAAPEDLPHWAGDDALVGMTARNRMTVERLAAYLVEQELIGAAPAVEEVFAV